MTDPPGKKEASDDLFLIPMVEYLEHICFPSLVSTGLAETWTVGEGRPGGQAWGLELHFAFCLWLTIKGFSSSLFPICSEPTQRPPTICERWRENLLEHYGGTPRDDQYVPQCDDLGHFTPLQCHGKSDFCWCVDKDGREVQGTRSQPGTTPACKHRAAPAPLS